MNSIKLKTYSNHISFHLQERDWLQEAVIDQEQSKEHTGIWKLVTTRFQFLNSNSAKFSLNR